MKEVDLEKEFESFLDNIEGVPRMWHSDEQIEWAKDIAKHFFELGTLSTITEEDCKLIWNIGDDLPYMQEEDFFKELLRRYKAQKGK